MYHFVGVACQLVPRLVPKFRLHKRYSIVEGAQLVFGRDRFDPRREPDKVDKGDDSVLQIAPRDPFGHGRRGLLSTALRGSMNQSTLILVNPLRQELCLVPHKKTLLSNETHQ